MWPLRFPINYQVINNIPFFLCHFAVLTGHFLDSTLLLWSHLEEKLGDPSGLSHLNGDAAPWPHWQPDLLHPAEMPWLDQKTDSELEAERMLPSPPEAAAPSSTGPVPTLQPFPRLFQLQCAEHHLPAQLLQLFAVDYLGLLLQFQGLLQGGDALSSSLELFPQLLHLGPWCNLAYRL